MAAPPIAGHLEVIQLATGNAAESITASFAAPAPSGVEIVQARTNRGDYTLDFTRFTQDASSGVMLSCIAELARDNNDGSGAAFATTSIAIEDREEETYFLPVSRATGGEEFNANASFVFLEYDEWLGGLAYPSAGTFVGVENGTPGLNQQSLFRSGVGEIAMNLSAYGASSEDGVLLVNSVFNGNSYAMTETGFGGRFTALNRDNGTEGNLQEDAPIAFGYVSKADVGTRAVAALGRLTGDGTRKVAAGEFTIVDVGGGRWDLTIAGHSPATGVLIVQPAASGVTSRDNILVSEWTGAAWRLQTLDIEPGQLNAQSIGAGEDAIAFVFFEFPVAGASSSADINLAEGGSARQSSTLRLPHPARADASLAIDAGAKHWMTATDPSETASDPWWEVELAGDADVTSVELLNGVAGHRSRLRDIRIQLLDSNRGVVATSPLLNPENAGHVFPAGPAKLSYEFPPIAQKTRFVRVSRQLDNDLSGTGGLGDPNVLSLREVVVGGEFVDPALVDPTIVRYDAEEVQPDPVSQGWEPAELINTATLADGRLGSAGNAGLSIEGEQVTWQVFDQLSEATADDPIYSHYIDDSGLRDAYELGWVFSARVKATSVATGTFSGFVGFEFPDSANPGWDIGGNGGAVVPLQFGRTAAGEFFCVRPWTMPAERVLVGSADDFHTLTAIGSPRSNLYEWFIDGLSQGVVNLSANDADHVTNPRLYFGAGVGGASDQSACFDEVTFASGESVPVLPGSGDLLFYLPFEAGPDGGETYLEQSKAPGSYPGIDAKPFIKLTGATPPAIVRGAVGAGIDLPTTEAGEFAGTFLDASEAAPELGDLGLATISFWMSGGATNLFAFSNSTEPDSYLRFDVRADGTAAVESLEDGVATGSLGGLIPNHDDGRWHHVAITFGAGGTLYYDGVEIAASSIGAMAAIDGIDTFTLGGLITSGASPSPQGTTGRIDEFAVWGRSMSSSEVANLYRLGYYGLPLALDPDGDSLNGFEEQALGTLADNPDSDGDGLGDLEEIKLGTRPDLADTDGDGVDDGAEQAAGTDPLQADTDGDGSPDGVDPDPLDSSVFPEISLADSDGDGLTDYEEDRLGTRKQARDFDGDKSDDFVEVMLGTDPNSGASKPDGVIDLDEDGLGADQDPDDSDPDSDDDTFSDLVELNSGSDPQDAASKPVNVVLEGQSMTLLQNGDVRFNFLATGQFSNLRVQSSGDLETFSDLQAVAPEVDGDYTVTVTLPDGHRFVRASAESAGEVVVSTTSANLVMPPSGVLEVTEGESLNQRVEFGAPFFGYVSYTLAGLTPGGRAIPLQQGRVASNGGSSVEIPLNFFDNLTVDPEAHYTLTLDANAGISPGLESSLNIQVVDNDERWSGTLGVEGEQMNFVLECATNGTDSTQRLLAPDGSGLCPKGKYAISASFDGGSFTASVGNIPLNRTQENLSGGASSISSMEFSGTVEGTSVSGSVELWIKPPGGDAVRRDGTFNLAKHPPLVPSVDLFLEDEAPANN